MLIRDIPKMKRFRKFESKKDGDTNQKKVEMTILISYKTDAREKKITGDKAEYNIIIKQ